MVLQTKLKINTFADKTTKPGGINTGIYQGQLRVPGILNIEWSCGVFYVLMFYYLYLTSIYILLCVADSWRIPGGALACLDAVRGSVVVFRLATGAVAEVVIPFGASRKPWYGANFMRTRILYIRI